MALPTKTFNEYHESIHVIRSREMLFALQISDYPHVQQKGRDKIIKATTKAAFPNEKKKVQTFDDFAKMVNRWQS